MEHWSDNFSLHEAMKIGTIAGYEPDEDIWDKRDYIIDLACHIIGMDRCSLGTGYDEVNNFLVCARGAAG